MYKKKTNNIFLLIIYLFKKYKNFCSFYILCLVLLYPIYYFINEHNVKYYNFSYDLSSTSPLMVGQDKPRMDLNKLNKSISSEIYNQISSIPIAKNSTIILNCSPIELENTCSIKIKNGDNKIILSVNESILVSIKRIDTKYKSQLNEEIRRNSEDIRLLVDSSKIINKIINSLDNNIGNANLGAVLEILVSNSLKVNELNSEINLLRAEVKQVENFVSQIELKLKKQLVKATSDVSFQNFSLKTYFLTILIGSIIMIFSFLVLIRD